MADEIVYNKKGEMVALHGKDAVSCMRVATIMSGIRMNIQTKGRMQLTRGANITHLLKLAGQYTGKTYKRTQKEVALADLQAWLDTMKLALPSREVD